MLLKFEVGTSEHEIHNAECCQAVHVSRIARCGTAGNSEFPQILTVSGKVKKFLVC